jgi:hypothetical protein
MTNQNPQDKINFLLEVKRLVSIELYRYCYMVGIDPATFNYKDFSEKELIGINFNENNIALKTHCKKMIKIERILKELNNE